MMETKDYVLPAEILARFPRPDRVHLMAQRSPEWLAIRKGKVTGSEASRLFPKRGTWDRLVREKAYETIGIDWRELLRKQREADRAAVRTVNRGNVEHVIRGTMLEPEVREHYRRLTDSMDSVFEVGFVQYQRRKGNDHFPAIDDLSGCSPDGINFKDGHIRLIEIKCPSDENFEKTRAVPDNYRQQMAFNCLMCGCRACDFIVFNRNLGMSVETIEFTDPEIYEIGTKLNECAMAVRAAAGELLEKIALDKG